MRRIISQFQVLVRDPEHPLVGDDDLPVAHKRNAPALRQMYAVPSSSLYCFPTSWFMVTLCGEIAERAYTDQKFRKVFNNG
jgi:hypothetical protein